MIDAKERRQRLDGTRKLLIVVGLLALAMNAFLYITADAQLATTEAGSSEAVENAVRTSALACAVVGLAFVGLAFSVARNPILVTIVAAILYLLCWLLPAVWLVALGEPELAKVQFLQGILIKAIVAACLANAIRTAFAVESNTRA